MGEDKTVTISDLTLDGERANNYVLAAAGNQGTATATIIPYSGYEYTIGWVDEPNVVGTDRVYDGQTHVMQVNVSVPNPSSVTFNYDQEPLSDVKPRFKDVDYETIRFTIHNGQHGQPGQTDSASLTTKAAIRISPRPVSVGGITAKEKFYDGTVTAELVYESATLDGNVDGDGLTVTGAGSFTDANVGDDKTVEISELALGGDRARNYTLAASGNQSSVKDAVIKPRPITIKANEQNVSPDGSIETGTEWTTVDVSEGSMGLVPGHRLAEITLTADIENGDIIPSGWKIVDADETDVTRNYAVTSENGTLIGKANPVISEEPTGNALTYNGQQQALASGGNVTGGEFVYSTSETGTYAEAIPTGKDVGNYDVWYMVKGDGNHNDLGPFLLTASIASAYSKVPVAKPGLVYTGEPQELVTAGEAIDATMFYAATAGDEAPGEDEYTPWIPDVTDAGTYRVWYMARGQVNSVPEYVTAMINPTDPETPTGLTATRGQVLADVALPEGWAWADGATRIEKTGTNTFKANYASTSANYKSKSDVSVRVKVSERLPEWGEATYEWSSDNRQVTAKRVDVIDGSFVETETAVAVSYISKYPTCTERGETTFSATFQNEDFGTREKTVDNIDVDPDVHAWGDWVVIKEATAEETGSATRTCANDPSHTETRTIPTIGHEHTPSGHVEAKDATCTEDGNIEYWTCAGCGRHLADDGAGALVEIEKEQTVIKALGHMESEPVRENETPATCEGKGSYDAAIHCLVCGVELYRGSEIEIAPLGHDWSAWVVTKEPTETEEGSETRTCLRCGKNETQSIQKLDPQRPTYLNAEGGGTWTKGSSVGLTFTFKRSVDNSAAFSHFVGIRVDAKDVAATDYDAVSGSVVITLHPAFLETLDVGGHELVVLFDDGDDAKATFTIRAAPEGGSSEKEVGPTEPSPGNGTGLDIAKTKPTSSASSPKTGDNNGAFAFALTTCALASFCAMLLALAKWRRKQHAGKRAKR